jgi:hypothetical protein
LQNCVTEIPLRRDSVGPLVRFRVGRLRLDDSVAHDTTMQRRQVRQEERFTSVHETLTEFGRGRNGFLQWPHCTASGQLGDAERVRLGHFVGGDALHSSLAAAMGLPATFPYRDLIVLTAFSVVLDTLVLHVLTLKPLLRALDFHDDGSGGRPKTLWARVLIRGFRRSPSTPSERANSSSPLHQKGKKKATSGAPRFIA